MIFSGGALKYMFATSIGKFCDSVLNYVANKPDGKYQPSSFSEGVKPAYEILFNNWLKTGEKDDVRLASLQALGSICACLSREQFEIELGKIVPTLLTFYKKEKNQEQQLPITQGLNNILLVAVKGGNRCLDPLVVIILKDIHPPACIPPDYTKSISIKNSNELLRCFQTICIEFSDNVITFLLEILQKTKDPKIRKGTIGIIKHLVTHASQQNADKKGLLVSGLKNIVETETSYEVTSCSNYLLNSLIPWFASFQLPPSFNFCPFNRSEKKSLKQSSQWHLKAIWALKEVKFILILSSETLALHKRKSKNGKRKTKKKQESKTWCLHKNFVGYAIMS